MTDRQKELLEEFEKIELEEKKAEKGGVASTIEKAWDRIKKFMGTDEAGKESKENEKA